MQSLTIALRFVKFYKIIKQYRIVVERHFQKTKDIFRVDMTNVTSLQDQEQQSQKKGKSSKKAWLAIKKCVCGLIYLFEKCLHIVQSNQSFDWTKIKKERDEIQQQICMRSIVIFNAIKRIIDTKILNNLTEDFVNQKFQISQIKNERAVKEFFEYHFVNTTYFGIKSINMIKSSNLLINSVIYDFEFNYLFINDKTRFRSEIRLAKNK